VLGGHVIPVPKRGWRRGEGGGDGVAGGVLCSSSRGKGRCNTRLHNWCPF
jgi:hypothetical protein